MLLRAQWQRTRFSTEECAFEDRVRSLRRVVSRVYGDAEVTARDPRSFTASLTAEWYGAVQVVTEESAPMAIARAAENVAGDLRRHIMARLQITGEALLTQDGRSARLRPGSLALYDAGRPFKVASSVCQRAHVLVMPRALLRLDEPSIRTITATVIAGVGEDAGADADDPGARLPVLATGLIQEIADAAPALREPLARAAADVIGSAVAEHVSGNRRAAADPRQVLLDRVKASIEDRLGDPDLNPQDIADQHHVSLRYLHLLFQREGTTVNGWIRERRLESARRDLSAPDARRRSVAAVAARWGFVNASHFSRAFREAFGVPPVQWRSHGRALTGVAPCIAGQNLGRAET